MKVGLDTTAKSGTFLLDTALRGNSNAGHSFEDGPRGNGVIGPLLTDEQRWALVEYLKSIPEEAGRVTPFGGPPNARRATRLGECSLSHVQSTANPTRGASHVRPYRWAAADRRPFGRSHRPVRVHEPGKSGADGVCRERLSIRGADAIFSNAIDHSIVVRRVTVAGLGDATKFETSDPEIRFNFRFDTLERGPAGQKPIQRGTCTLPDGQTLRFVVNDEKGASTPDGTFRVFAGLRSDPFILAWIIPEPEAVSKSALSTTMCFALLIEFDTRRVLDPDQGSLFGVIAETVPMPGARRFRRASSRHASTGSAVRSRPIFGLIIAGLWAQTTFAISGISRRHLPLRKSFAPLFLQRLKDSLANWDMRDGKQDWTPSALAANANMFLDDFMLFDVAKPITDTSHLEIEKSTLNGQPYQTGGGRTVDADVIDVLLTWMVNRDREPLEGGTTKATQARHARISLFRCSRTRELQTVADSVDARCCAGQGLGADRPIRRHLASFDRKIKLDRNGKSASCASIETIDGKQIVERLDAIDNSAQILSLHQHQRHSSVELHGDAGGQAERRRQFSRVASAISRERPGRHLW